MNDTLINFNKELKSAEKRIANILHKIEKSYPIFAVKNVGMSHKGTKRDINIKIRVEHYE